MLGCLTFDWWRDIIFSMNKQLTSFWVTAFVITCGVSVISAREDGGYIADRLEVGLRAAHVRLDKSRCWNDDSNSGFLGTISHLYETKNFRFSNVVLSYKLTDWFAIGATWDETAELAGTHLEDDHIDGEWRERGPTLSAVFIAPRMANMFEVYAEVGAHFPDAEFDAYPWWTYGYSSYERYQHFGSRNKPFGGYSRHIEATQKDDVTLACGIGLKCYITRNLALDIAYRHIDCDVNAHFYLIKRGDLMTDRGQYVIPFSYSQLCAGLRWAF